MNTTAGYTGRIFEAEVLGECTVRTDGGYMKFRPAMDAARKAQPWRQSPVLTSLLTKVSEKLQAPVGAIKAFTAVGSTLDVFHGVDGWFEWQGTTVTVDVTLRRNKPAKAQVLITGDDLDTDFTDTAEEIARQFRRALNLGWTGAV